MNTDKIILIPICYHDYKNTKIVRFEQWYRNSYAEINENQLRLSTEIRGKW